MTKLLLALALICGNAIAGANYSEAPLSRPAVNIVLYVPWESPAEECQMVSKWPGTSKSRDMVLLHTSFAENFDVMPELSTGDGKAGVWATHLDGGYYNGKFAGYDWEVKRYQPVGEEEQLYVDPAYKGSGRIPLGLSPFSLTDGVLSITAQRASSVSLPYLYGQAFTSGLLSTHQMFAQQYGYFEISAKVPKSEKLLPAFWLLPVDRSWPPELDVFEAPGHEPLTVTYGSHWKDTNGVPQRSGCKAPVAYDDGEFHTFGLLWTSERVVYFFDRLPYAQIKTKPGQSQPMYMMANLAVGGVWPGHTTPSTPMPQVMQIDYIAAWSAAGSKGCAKDERGVMICR